jgi:hypothetical protein
MVAVLGTAALLAACDAESGRDAADISAVEISAGTTAAVPATDASTTAASSTVPATSTVPPISDEEVAAATLIDAATYASGWTDAELVRPALDTTIAASIPACSAFSSSVFEAANNAVHADTAFRHEVPTEAMMYQNVLVFADDAAAGTFVESIADPAFPACGVAYTIAGGPALDSCVFYANVGTPSCGTAAFGAIGDELVGSLYESTWVQPITGELHGPEEVYGAIVRVGRTVILTGSLHMGDAGDSNVEVVTLDQYTDALRAMAAKATAAIARGA